jgi:archaellum biogenesis protein FlaJ (TadC family)
MEYIGSLDLELILEWILSQATNLWWLLGISTFAFIATLIAVPAFVIRIPSNYFSRSTRPTTELERQHPRMRALGVGVKNIVGLILILMGIVMLIIPGQGFLTITIGFMLIDFPGKYRLERWLVSRRQIMTAMNMLRDRAGKKPLDLEESGTANNAPS